MIKISKGLDIPISGSPDTQVDEAPKARTVAVLGYDHIGMKPTMLVKEGDRVRTGQALFTDKKTEGVQYTAPATGVVSAINRGPKRVFESLVIDCEEDEYVDFGKTDSDNLANLNAADATKTLVDSGMWTALRTRPMSKVPAPDTKAHSIFVTAMDTNPLAGNPVQIIQANQQAFSNGLTVLSRLDSGTVYVVTADHSGLVGANISGVSYESFSGPHPAGLVGTHIHHLDPVHAKKTVWTIGYQDVIAIGKLFTDGKLFTERTIALGGPMVRKPRMLKTRMGANLLELTAGELEAKEHRIISGSVLAGREASGTTAYLGRYHNQVSVLAEGRDREFMGWFSAGSNRHSVKPIYLSHWFGKGRKFDMTTNTNGSERAIVPIGAYETVMPLDILATPLLKALAVGDTEMAQHLGALELDEEDLGLCSYVCPGKYEFGRVLRDNLTRIEKEG
ncbi:MAG: Na(+)-translocating NADH-quinone reductase subunit A [Pseudomonadales bacterium]